MEARWFNPGPAMWRYSDAKALMQLPPRLLSSSVSNYSGSSQEFKYFPKLPPELRIMIFRFAMLQPRIIELENYRRRGEVYVCVSRQSTTELPLMRACLESRRECQRVYRLRRFDNLPDILRLSRDKNVWWNPELDIICLGTNTCPSTCLQLCQFSHDYGTIPRVALMGERCPCRWGCGDCQLGGTPDQPLGYHPPCRLGNLHGYKSGSVPDRFSGCAGLKELFLVVGSKLWVPSVGPYVSFRHATSNGLRQSHITFKAHFIRTMDFLKTTPRFSDIGRNKWLGDRCPAYQLVSFAPIGYGKMVFDALTLTKFAFERLRSLNMQKLEQRTGCYIIIPDYSLPGGAHSCIREVGLCGSRESIFEAKKEIARCIFYPQGSGWKGPLAKLTGESEYACRACVWCCLGDVRLRSWQGSER